MCLYPPFVFSYCQQCSRADADLGVTWQWVLIILPDFEEELLAAERNNYVERFFIDSWKNVEQQVPNVELRTIQDAHLFIMLDQLDRLNEVVGAFVRKNDPKAEIGRR